MTSIAAALPEGQHTAHLIGMSDMVPIGEVASPKQWRTLAKADMVAEGYPVYGANGVIGYATEYTHEQPTLVIGCRGTIGAVHITQPKAFITSNAMALDALDTDRVDMGYLARFLAWRGLTDVTSGSSQPQLTRQNLVRVEIPVPSLVEQRRAASLLDQVAALTAKHRETATQLDRLVGSSFAERFTAGAFPLVRLDSIADIHGGGRHGLSGNHFVAEGVPAYGAGGLNGYLEHAEYGDRDAVILSAIGARCGKCFLARGAWTTLANTQVILPREDVVDVDYLWFLLNDEGRWPRSGSAQPFIKPSDVKAHLVPLPPLELQREFAAIAAEIRAVRATVERAVATSGELFTSLQMRTFSGML